MPTGKRLKLYRGVWCIYWRDDRGRSRRASLGTADQAAAQAAFERWQDDSLKPAENATVSEIVSAYLKDRKDRIAHPEAMALSWRSAESFFGKRKPSGITRQLCRDYARKRMDAHAARPLSAGTIRKQLGIMSAALKWHDKRTPAEIELPSPPPPKSRFLTRKEAGRLVSACRDHHIRLFVILALTTAARASALRQLKWSSVDLDRGRINLGPSVGNKGRAVVPINETARQALVLAREGATSDYVIEYAGGPVASVKKGFAGACQRAELEGVTPHVLRHTAAVWMAEAGTPMSEISQYLGHTSTAVTERVYARYSPDYLKSAAAALELEPPQKVQMFKGELPKRRQKPLR
ncbi:MAG: site-specific integrase [Planctomycetes bacterium]|nr:site-specific integrase [Planctomycetota bacterium]